MAKLNKWEQQHLKNVLSYEALIDEVYKTATREAAAIGTSISKISADKVFSFADYPQAKRRVETLLETLKNSLMAVIVNGVRSEWKLANNKNDELCNQVFGSNVGKLPQNARDKYFSTHADALEAFENRKKAGLKLSDRVWNYTNQFKDEIELGLDVGIRSGRSADALSRDLRSYLKYPDKLFRRVRDEHGKLHLSKNAAAFHPGRGVYRSSYKNARRLAATETNIAYRTADYTRWQDFDFVVGIKIEVSKSNHVPDICDDLAGEYPKDFKWTGWHPHCRCHALTINKTKEEMATDTKRILNGEEPLQGSVNNVNSMPQAFNDWFADNEERLQNASTVPYFVSDNPKYTGVHPHYGAVGTVTGTKLGRAATKAAFKVYEDMPAPTFTEDVTANTEAIARDMGMKGKPIPMTFLEANEGRGNVSFGKGYEFSSNCQATVVIHEARLRGLDVTALGYNWEENSFFHKLGDKFEEIWINPKTGKVPIPTKIRGTSFDSMLGKVDKATKATGRYHIGINFPKNEGHVITAERLSDGRMIYYDAQNGAFLNIEEYAISNVEYFEVLKVDKLLLNKDNFKQIARLL